MFIAYFAFLLATYGLDNFIVSWRRLTCGNLLLLAFLTGALASIARTRYFRILCLYSFMVRTIKPSRKIQERPFVRGRAGVTIAGIG